MSDKIIIDIDVGQVWELIRPLKYWSGMKDFNIPAGDKLLITQVDGTLVVASLWGHPIHMTAGDIFEYTKLVDSGGSQ